MTNKGQISSEELKIQGLLDRFLQFRKLNSNFDGQENHLNDDSLTAFVEGNISEIELPSMLRHLINCSFCLHITTELAKLSEAFAEDEFVAAAVPTAEPTKVADVLNGFLARLFGTTDGAVFAHQEQEKQADETPEIRERKPD